MYVPGMPMLGAQATSLTQSVWPVSSSSIGHLTSASLWRPRQRGARPKHCSSAVQDPLRVAPYPHDIVAPARRKLAPRLRGRAVRCQQRARGDGRRPRDGIDAEVVREKDFAGGRAVVWERGRGIQLGSAPGGRAGRHTVEAQDGHLAVTARAREYGSELVWRPADRVD